MAATDSHGERRVGRSYQRRTPEHGTLYKVLQAQLGSFAAAAETAGDSIPKFVYKELRSYLACGILAYGFARVQCASCPFERWVPFACRGRGICPSCGGKRMTSLAAELTEGVIPFVPVRQFVLSVPHRLRYLLAYDHDRCTAALRIFIRALTSLYRRRARKAGIADGRSGSVTFIQRFGSAANLHVHFHVVALDGVFWEAADGQLRFHEAAAPSEEELQRLVSATRARVHRYLLRAGVYREHNDNTINVDPVAEASAVLAGCYAGSVQGRQTLGRRQGAKLQRIGADPHAPWRDVQRPLHAQLEGFDLDASRRVRAQRVDMRGRLEELLRYCARPAISDDRLSLDARGQVILRLKTPWHYGSTHVVYEPLDFVSKLAALIPRPQKNLVIYHGVLAANATWRARAVAYGRPARAAATAPGAQQDHAEGDHAPRPAVPRHVRRQWAEMMRRGLGLDVLACPRCGGRMRLLGLIVDRGTAKKLLQHAKLPTEPPPLAPARGPAEADPQYDDIA